MGRDVGDCRRGLLCFGLFFFLLFFCVCLLGKISDQDSCVGWHCFTSSLGCLFVCNFAHLLSYLPVLMVNHGAFTRFSLVLFL